MSDKEASLIQSIDLFGTESTGCLTHEKAPGVELRMVWVTPELAANYDLLNAVAQRKVSKEATATYASDMDDDEWAFLGDPIRFDVTGHMIDGQHRARAIVRSGRAQLIVVITGLPVGIMRYVDMGRRRTYADTLRIRDIPQHVSVAALVRAIYFWDHGFYGIANVPRRVNISTVVRPSNAALDSTFEKMTASGQDPIASVQAASRLKTAVASAVPLKTVTTAYVLFGRVDPYQRDEFFARIADEVEGEKITRGTFAPNLLRSRMSRSIQGTGEYLEMQEWLHLFIHGWNLWRNGEDREALQRPRKPILSTSWAYPDGLAETV